MEDSTNVGLVNIKPLLCKTDPKLIEEIASKRGMLLGTVIKMMSNNRWTILQYSELVNKTTQYIHFLLKPEVTDYGIKTKLNHCFPYPTANNNGPKFVVRDEKSEKFLTESLRDK